ncbi:MAG: Mrp/NBP35 family ATP-binding protein [Candidatus Bathyarchaeota archaeon]|nr:Mrp/NBP35 family ATP-binding protein [Candidatus Bathyarchaeota archaeon]
MNKVDPRTTVINERLRQTSRIIAVSSGKGGVGKSLVATTLALTLAQRGCKVGLFDLDFTSPSTHLIMGVKDAQPKENKGIIPPVVKGLAYMSLIQFSGDQVAPLRGADVSNALIELLAVTQWGKLDFLVLDMPPGIGDAVLDLVRLVKRIEFLIVTTPSLLAFETVKKQVRLLQDLKIPIIGVLENIKMNSATNIERETEKLGLKFLSGIPYDPGVEDAIGDVTKLRDTTIANRIKKVVANNITQ